MHCTLEWLPQPDAFREKLRAARALKGAEARTAALALAQSDLNFVQINALDQMLQAVAQEEGAPAVLRLAVLGSSTMAHLYPSIRIAGLRRGLEIVIYEPDYGQFRQDVFNPSSGLYSMAPHVVLFAFDAPYLAASCGLTQPDGDMAAAVARCERDLLSLWNGVQEKLGAVVIQQTVLPVFVDILGENEQRLATSKAHFVARVNAQLPQWADAQGVHLLAVDRHAAQHGLKTWHDPALWHRAKQEISLHAAPYYGDLVARLLGALRGRSAKVLVLDLDNTLWGGVIGDDGLEGIVLGQGSAAGEAFAAVQSYALALSERGILLAVCSKNDEAVALRAFDAHPEMILRRSHIASFVANWEDKASNLRRIAQDLNLGLDALVFLDDNPFERNLVRQELPMVAVPEVSDDPAQVPGCLAAAGYFEGVAVTSEDAARLKQYQANRERQALAENATDLESYLRGLEMRLLWGRFDATSLPRVVQLVNKTNQFNLTTRRMTEPDARRIMEDPTAIGLHFRLTDRFGDNGLIGVLIGQRAGTDLKIDVWLMSCRVLGRKVEQAMLRVIVAQAAAMGITGLIGEYIPSPKNGMVKEHYDRLGFGRRPDHPGDGASYYLALPREEHEDSYIHIEEIER